MSAKHTTEKALQLLRHLPRVQIGNIRDNPNSRMTQKRGRGQHGGDYHGHGNKGSTQRQNYMRLGYETGNTPFHLRFTYEPYYRQHHLRREYPPITLHELQRLIDTNRVDISKPIDLTTLVQTGLMDLKPDRNEFGFQIHDEGANIFKSKINIEVQHASELVIATIEKNGGIIRTAYYDQHSIQAMRNPKKWFERGTPLPRRMIPPQDAIEYYTDPKNRGYLADPAKISEERLILAQKYGYELPKIEDDPDYELLMETKDPRQIFYGLEPGIIVNLIDKTFIKMKEN